MASATTLISPAEYLATSHSPDREYVDGYVIERNLGQKNHSKLQMAIAAYFYSRRVEWQIAVWPEQRIQTKPYRYRVPDICVTFGEPDEQVFTKPPYLCIEILSPDDRIADAAAKAEEYLAAGVPFVWLIEPETLSGWIYNSGKSARRVDDGGFTEPFPIDLNAL